IGAPAVGPLGEVAGDVTAQPGVRQQAGIALGRTGPAALKEGLKLLDSTDARARMLGASVLGRAPGRDSVRRLAEALKDAEPTVRTAAVESLGRLGPAATHAPPALAGAIQAPPLHPPNYA